MKINKEATQLFGIFILFLGMWDVIVILGFLLNEPTEDIPLTILLNLVLFYLITDTGYSQFKKIIKGGFSILLWLIPIILIGIGVVLFFNLPPITMVALLLLILISQK